MAKTYPIDGKRSVVVDARHRFAGSVSHQRPGPVAGVTFASPVDVGAEKFCANCQTYVDTVWYQDEQFCSACGEDDAQLFEDEYSWGEAAREDAETLLAESAREEF